MGTVNFGPSTPSVGSSRIFKICKMPPDSLANTDKNQSKKAQKWLDHNQYSRNGILRYEEIFGRTYVSVGGEATTKRFVSQLDLKPGQKVLDVGCGTGGGAFYMARNYGVEVYGIDLSNNMIGIAQDYRDEMEPEVQHRVQFYVDDATTMNYPENFYDVVYSRDTILHIDDKLSLYKKLLKCLKPGGKLMVTDYNHGDKEHSEIFKKYVAGRGYLLLTVDQYGDIIRKAGFNKVVNSDVSSYMMEIMKDELVKFANIKEKFIIQFSEEDYDYIYNGWVEKMGRVNDGDQVWGFYTATK